MNRRQLLKTLGLTTLGASARFGALPLSAQASTGYKALVAIELAGGNDGNSILIPCDSSGLRAYLAGRGALALSPQSLLQVNAASAAYGLHPSMVGLRSLYNEGRLAFAANLGNLLQPTTKASILSGAAMLPEGLFGHDSQANEFSAAAGTSSATIGWGGAIADQLSTAGGRLPPLLGVAGASVFSNSANSSSMVLASPSTSAYVGYDNSAASQARLAAFQAISSSDSASVLVEATNHIRKQSITQSETLRVALDGAPKLQTVFPQSALGAQLAFVARIISVRSALGATRQVFSCVLGGFDMHSDVLATSSTLLSDLSACLTAFDAAMQELGTLNSVTAFTLSEFSRTLQPNTSQGVDHAWGSNHMVLGGAVAGGAVHGTYPSLILGGADDYDTTGRWIPTTATTQYGASLAKWFGLSDTALQQVFPLLNRFPSGVLPLMRS